jgi:protein gp37
MAENSKIEWTDATWQPITGCSVVSPGCTNCYAMRLAGTRLRHHPSRAGLTKDTKAGPVWTGEVRFNEQWLLQPLRWRRPRTIFVCAHGDMFHEAVPDEWIDRVFAVMALAPQHTFQVLTKRAGRMRDYMSTPARKRTIAAQAMPVSCALAARGGHGERIKLDHFSACFAGSGPFANVWLGVSAERQQEAGARIPDLLATPAAVRFLSAEPLLGPIDLLDIPWHADRPTFPEIDDISEGRSALHMVEGSRLDWIIVGGESGPGARPMHPDWARSIRDQCASAGVPFFMKQMAKKAAIPADLFVRQMPLNSQGEAS